jgi:hypothetical protein
MGIISGIVDFLTSVAEFVVAPIAAAIAAPTVPSVLTAVASVAVVVGAGYLVYKGVSKVLDIFEKRVCGLQNAENIPLRFKPLDREEVEIEMEQRAVNRRSERSAEDVAERVFSLDDTNDRRRRRDDDDDDIFDEIRRNRTRRYCDDIDDLRYDSIDNRFHPTLRRDRYDDEYTRPIVVIDSKSAKRKNKKKKSKIRNYVDAEYTDILNDMYDEKSGGIHKSIADSVLALHGLGPDPSTICLS